LARTYLFSDLEADAIAVAEDLMLKQVLRAIGRA
jgi:hypothetical protein